MLKIWAKRHHDLSRARNQIACRLHAALCELVPGGLRTEIYAAQAEQILQETEPCGAVQQARAELAAELVADLRRVDALLRETKKKLAVAVRASGTTVTEVFGVGPVIAATVIGDVRDVSRFGSRDRFAAYNGSAPIEVSSGHRVIHRLSLRGNRRLNHVIHMAAITQIRYQHSDPRCRCTAFARRHWHCPFSSRPSHRPPASRPGHPDARPLWMSTRCGALPPGTGGSPWPCSRWPSSPSPR